MSEDVKKLFAERLGRYQATIALKPTDRVEFSGQDASQTPMIL